MAPPTIHPSGVAYEWQTELTEIAEVPEWLVALLQSDSKRSRVRPGSSQRRRRRMRPTTQVLQWVHGEDGIPGPQWVKTARIAAELWDDPAEYTVEEIGGLIYEALIRSPDYDPERPWSRSERVRDAARLLSRERPR